MSSYKSKIEVILDYQVINATALQQTVRYLDELEARSIKAGKQQLKAVRETNKHLIEAVKGLGHVEKAANSSASAMQRFNDTYRAGGSKMSSFGTGWAEDWVKSHNNFITNFGKRVMSPFSEQAINNIAGATAALGAASMMLAGVEAKLISLMKVAIEASQKFQKEAVVLGFNMDENPAQLEAYKKRALLEGGLYGPNEMLSATRALVAAGMSGQANVLNKFGQREMRNMADIALTPTLQLATMMQGKMGLEDVAETVVAMYQKSNVDLEKSVWHRGKLVTQLDVMNDQIAQWGRSFSAKPEQIKTMLNSARSVMSQTGMQFSEALAITGTLMSGGMTTAESGQRLSMVSSMYANLQGKAMQQEMYEALRGQIGGGRGKWGKLGDHIAGAKGSMLGKKGMYWINEVFGNKQEFEKFMDGTADDDGMVSFSKLMVKLEDHTKGMSQGRKLGFLTKFYGNSQLAKAQSLFENSKTMLEQDVLVTDEYGRWLDKAGKIVYKREQAEVKWKKGTYTGLNALLVNIDKMKDSGGLGDEFTKRLEKTFDSAKKMWDAAKESFMILTGSGVIDVLDTLLRGVTGALKAFNNFLHANPLVAKAIGWGAGLLTVILGIGTVVAMLFSMMSFSGFIFKSAFVNFREGMMVFKSTGVGKAVASATAVGGKGVLSVAGGALISKLGFANLGTGLSKAWALADVLFRVGVLLKNVLGFFIPFFAKLAMGIVFFEFWIKMLNLLTGAFMKQEKAVDNSMTAIERFAMFFKKLAATIDFLGKVFTTGEATNLDIAEMGDMAPSALKLTQSGVFRFLSGFYYTIKKLDEDFVNWLEQGGAGTSISQTESYAKKGGAALLAGLIMKFGLKRGMLATTAAGLTAYFGANAALAAESATGSETVGLGGLIADAIGASILFSFVGKLLSSIKGRLLAKLPDFLKTVPKVGEVPVTTTKTTGLLEKLGLGGKPTTVSSTVTSDVIKSMPSRSGPVTNVPLNPKFALPAGSIQTELGVLSEWKLGNPFSKTVTAVEGIVGRMGVIVKAFKALGLVANALIVWDAAMELKKQFEDGDIANMTAMWELHGPIKTFFWRVAYWVGFVADILKNGINLIRFKIGDLGSWGAEKLTGLSETTEERDRRYNETMGNTKAGVNFFDKIFGKGKYGDTLQGDLNFMRGTSINQNSYVPIGGNIPDYLKASSPEGYKDRKREERAAMAEKMEFNFTFEKPVIRTEEDAKTIIGDAAGKTWGILKGYVTGESDIAPVKGR